MRTLHTARLVPRARELRRGQTPAERKLWFRFLRTHAVKFRRQVPVQGYILDFYASALRLCIELDGATHDGEDAQHYDAARTAVLEGAGLTVIRFCNADVLGQFDAVCAAIDLMAIQRR